MKLSIAGPTPAGAAVFWDIRCWHGGTPNLSREVRAIPGCGFTAPWLSSTIFGADLRGILPRAAFDGLSERGQRAARELEPGPDGPPAGVRWEPEWDVVARKPGNAAPGSVNDRRGLQVDSVDGPAGQSKL